MNQWSSSAAGGRADAADAACAHVKAAVAAAAAPTPTTTTTVTNATTCAACARERGRSVVAPSLCLSCGGTACERHAAETHAPPAGCGATPVLVNVATGVVTCLACGPPVNATATATTTTRNPLRPVSEPAATVARTLVEHFRKRPRERLHPSVVLDHVGHEPLKGLDRRGLMNLGNTCYINAVAQSLHSAKALQQQQQQLSAPDPASASALSSTTMTMTMTTSPPRPPVLFDAFTDLFQTLGGGGKDAAAAVADPTRLVSLVKSRMPLFDSIQQQDAHEFLRVFSDHLLKEKAWTGDAFSGSILSEISCPTCGRIEAKLEPCLDLSLEFPDPGVRSHVVRLARVGPDAPPLHARPLRLDDCLKRFVKPETLMRDPEYARCRTCQAAGPPSAAVLAQGLTPCTKRLSLWSMPRLLVVHLKRFKWIVDTPEKVHTYVQFPLRGLSLEPYKSDASRRLDGVAPPSSTQPSRFRLVAVVVHHGKTLGGGHYTSYCLDTTDERWFHYDDEHVTPVDEEVVARCEAYMLFYAAEDVGGGGGGDPKRARR